MMVSKRGCWACLLCGLVACDLEDADPAGTARSAILGGTVDTDPANDGVVGVLDDAGGECTGTLIGPRAVVMQAFCMHGAPTDLTVMFGPDLMPTPDATVAVTDVVFHPDYDPVDYDSPNLAVAILAEDAPSGIAPIPPLPAALGLTDADEGAMLTFLGYGPTTRDGTDFGTRRTIDAAIDQVCDDGTECAGRTDLVLIDLASGGGPCMADGPGFLERAGTRYLAALSYASDENCLVQGFGLSLGRYESFLAEFLGTAADADADAETDAESDAGTDAAADADADAAPDGAVDTPAETAEDAFDALEDGDGPPPDADAGSGGCSCRASSASGVAAWWLLGAALLTAGRLRRRGR